MKIYGGKVNNRGIKEKYSILDGKFIIPREYLYSNKETINIVQQLINEKFPKIEVDTMAVIKRMSLSYLYSYPSCSYNAEDTEEEKLELQDKVKPIKSKIQKNEKLISIQK